MDVAIWCGIDWAEHHHDVALVDDVGKLIAKLHIDDDAAGFARLLTLLAEHGAGPETPVPIAMETAHGLLAAALVAAGYRLFPINPMAVARYRDRYSVSRAKSDAGDAFVLANILRTDLDAHRPLPVTASSRRPFASSPAPSKTPCGSASRPVTSSARCSVSITRPRSSRFLTSPSRSQSRSCNWR